MECLYTYLSLLVSCTRPLRFLLTFVDVLDLMTEICEKIFHGGQFLGCCPEWWVADAPNCTAVALYGD
jgi:hypothetical protein